MRKRVALQGYGERKRPLVEEWLRRKENEADQHRRLAVQFDGVFLEPEHEELLSRLVEAVRRVPRDQREKFLLIQMNAGDFMRHPGLTDDGKTYVGDVEALAHEDLVAISSIGQHGGLVFDVTPRGSAYYQYLKQRLGEPTERITAEIRTYLHAQSFRKRYVAAFEKWTRAEELLWGTDTQGEFTTIGHLCREALQEFADALVTQHQLTVDSGKAQTVARIRAVLDHHREKLGDAEHALLHALVAYWGAVNDLVQRQEHGGQKEGQPLMWEDGRRVVFQTAVVMFEIDWALSRVT